MKSRNLMTIALTLVIPALFLLLMSQNLVRAADSALAPLVDEADLGIEKSGPPGAVAAGSLVTYTLEISNSGTLAAANVIVTDTLPLNSTVEQVWTSRGGDCLEAAEVLCPLGDFQVDDSVTITVVVTVDPDTTDTLHNVARVRSNAAETNTANNRDTLDSPVFAEADMSVSKIDSTDPVDPGSSISYTLSVANLGPSDATGVVLTDTLPSSITLVSVSPSQGPACDEGSQVVCELGTIEAGEQATVLIEVDIDETFAGLLVNSAEVRSAAADPDESNNTTSEGTTVDAIADLSVSKTSTPSTAVAGAELTYHLIVTNSSVFSATNVMLTDVLPSNTSVITTSASQGDCALGSTVTCTVGVLEAGAWAWVDIDVLVDSATTDDLFNLVETSTDTRESDYLNNSYELTTTLTISADVSVGKTADPDPAVAGSLLTYNIVVSNEGPSDALGVHISDTLPLSTTFVSASVVQGAKIVRTIDTSLWEPSSPDPAGLAYIAAVDRLMVSDSEVDEPAANRDENLFTATRQGELITVTTTTEYSEEPTGLAYDPESETLFVSDDVLDRVFMVLAGPDGIFGTADDDVTYFQTNVFSNTVPEGLAFDTHRGHLFTVDGSLNDVFDIDPGDDETFGTPDDVITSFDVRNNGILDAESIAYNPESQTIWIGDHASPTVIETTIDGLLLRTFDLTPDTVRVSGLTVAPSTANPSVLSLFMADRAVDNNQDPNENDGKIYEVAIPSSASPGASCSGDAIVECNLGTITAGESALVSIVVQVDILATGVLTNSVAVESTTPDGNSDNDHNTLVTPVTTRADLVLAKSDDPDTVVAGEQLTYTLVINNRGPSHAVGVMLEDVLPANTAVYTTAVSQGSGCTGSTVVLCDLGQIMAGHQATVTIVVDVGSTALGSLTNNASVSSATADDFPEDNSAVEVTTVTTLADLAIGKTATPLEPAPGGTITFTVTISNHGPSAATGVQMIDTLPDGVVKLSATPSQGSSCLGTTAILCNLGVLDSGYTATITIVVQIEDEELTGDLTNTAEVFSTVDDPDETNNSAMVTATIPKTEYLLYLPMLLKP